MAFHRLTTPTYIGGLPGTHDKINDPADPSVAGSGVPALTDTLKSGGPNDGSYFVAFGEDATSTDANRPHTALAENTDFLDDVMSGEVPVADNVDAVASGAVTTHQITGDVFVGKSGTAQIPDEYDRLVQIVESVTNNEIITVAGLTVKCVGIFDSTDSTDQVGLSASGFETDPVVHISPAIPDTTPYRLIFGRRTSLNAIVKTKATLDAFTRLAIRGAHEVPGETQRFIREAGRRVGGSVAALVGTIMETPGIGENILGKANAMFMDVDPDATVGTGGTWSVRFDRDTTPQIHMRVNEGTGGDSTWENVFERLAFKDFNTSASGFGETDIPLTSSATGEEMIRVFGGDPGAVHPIVRRLNSTHTVTCGNGSTTFGDFNGTGALSTALALADTLSVEVFHIILKRGTYFVDNDDWAPSSGSIGNVLIEGVRRAYRVSGSNSGVVITNNAAAGAGLITSLAAGKVEFRNIRFDKGSTSDIAVDSGSNIVKFVDCWFVDQTVKTNWTGDLSEIDDGYGFGQNKFVMKDCVLDASVTALPAIHLEMSGSVPAVDGVLIEDCHFLGADDNPILRIENGDVSAAGLLDNVVFNRCRIELGSTTDDGGGDYTGNSGALELVHGTTSNLSLGSITWKDCVVLVAPAPSAVQVLLHLRTSDGTGTITVDNVNILGGRWEYQDANTAISGFYISGEEFDDVGVTNVTIEDIDWGIDAPAASRDYGTAPAEVVFTGSEEDWAQFYINAVHIRMKKVRWLGNVARARAGQLYLRATVWEVDGVDVGGPWVDTALFGTFAPRRQVTLESAAQVLALVRGTVRELNVTTFPNITNLTGNQGIIFAIPNGHMRLENCFVTGFTNASAVGFGQIGDSGFSGTGLHMIDCRSNNNGSGFLYTTATGGQEPEDVLIEGCVFENNAINGVRIISTGTATPPTNMTISNCLFRNNTGEGILLDTVVGWTSTDAPGLMMYNNQFVGNNGASSNHQIHIDNPGTMKGVFMGNSGASSGAGLGTAHFASAVPVDVRGTETGWDSNNAVSGEILFLPGDRIHTNGNDMLLNAMRFDAT